MNTVTTMKIATDLNEHMAEFFWSKPDLAVLEYLPSVLSKDSE